MIDPLTAASRLPRAALANTGSYRKPAMSLDYLINLLVRSASSGGWMLWPTRMILSGLAIKLVELAGLLQAVATIMRPVTVDWLGLRLEMGIPLLFGLLRKELTLIMLATLLNWDFAVLTPLQMIVFTFVVMLYIPCVATIAVLVKEAGLKRALFITVFEILFSLLAGGILTRVLSLAGVP